MSTTPTRRRPSRLLAETVAVTAGAAMILIAAVLVTIMFGQQGLTAAAGAAFLAGLAGFAVVQRLAFARADRYLTARAATGDDLDTIAAAAGVLTTDPPRPGRHAVDTPTAIIPAATTASPRPTLVALDGGNR